MLLLTLPLLSAACTKPVSRPVEQAERLIVPQVKEYTPAQQKQVAMEMETHCPVAPMMCQLVTDYGVMRDEARASLGKRVDVAR